MNASKFIAIAALATAFGGTAFAGELSYNDGASATKSQAVASSTTRAEVQAGATNRGTNSLSYNDGAVATKSQAAAIRTRDEVRAEAGQRKFSRSLAYNTSA